MGSSAAEIYDCHREPGQTELGYAALVLLEQLKEGRLLVIKLDDKRAVIQQNAEWYREFCARYESLRPGYKKLRTIIRRQRTIDALEEIASGRSPDDTVYGSRLKPFLEDVYENCIRGQT